MKEERITSCKRDLDELLAQKRSIYSKLDSHNKIALAKNRKLVRGLEEKIIVNDPNIMKCKAFGLSPKMLVTNPENAFNYLRSKDYKSHKPKSSNADLHQSYYNFELLRKRLINNCYNVNWSDEKVYYKIDYYLKLDNPFKVDKRGYLIPDNESIDTVEYIDEKGEVYVFR